MDIRVTFNWGNDQPTVEMIEGQKITHITELVEYLSFKWNDGGAPVLQVAMKEKWDKEFMGFDGFCGVMIVHAQDTENPTKE